MVFQNVLFKILVGFFTTGIFPNRWVNYSVFTKACCVLNGVKVFYLLTWTEHVSGNILTN